MVTAGDLRRFFDELHATPTRRAAEDIFADADWIFVGMYPKARQAAYQQIEDIIKGKRDAAD
jgi:hypothetical protein